MQSIADAVDRMNALPSGPDGACFVASLPRPLAIVATTNGVSAQPAGGPSDPRVFLMLVGLVATVVPDGDSSKRMELGQWTGTTRTMKGEIELPVTSRLAPESPYQHALWTAESTTCSKCHRDEAAVKGMPGSFDSLAYKPEPDKVLKAKDLADLHDACAQSGETSARCALFHALFDFGDVKDGEFPAEVTTF